MILEGKKLSLIDSSDKITIADSFVHPAQKLGRGHGEAKLYVGNKNEELWKFFGSETGFTIKCFFEKNDLLNFMDDLKPEYENPNLPYERKSELPNLFNQRKEKVNQLQNIIWLNMDFQSQIAGPRVYLNSNDEHYKLLRELPLPRLCYLIFAKFKDEKNNFIFKIRLFINYREISDTNEHPQIIREEIDKIEKDTKIPTGDRLQIIRARRGQPEFRDELIRTIPFCPVTTVTDERLLEACHIKPRIKCTASEQMDSMNGVMLTPTIHTLFDDGFITFEEKKIKVSPFISKITLKKLDITDGKRVDLLQVEGREKYFEFHRNNIFKS